MEKLVQKKNKDDGREKGEEGIGGSIGPYVFLSSHIEFGFKSTPVQATDINTDFEGKESIYMDQNNMYKCTKEG